MTLRQLLFRSLRYYWRTGIVILFGVAVATAVITGSLLVGDSVRGSLRDTALSRLGEIDHALVSPSFFRRELADDLLSGKGRVAPLILTQGVVRHADTDATVPNVAVIGVNARFPAALPALAGREVAVNAALARDLQIAVGDALLVHVGQASAIPGDSLFARRKREETVRTLRVQVAAVVPDAGAGGFALAASTATPRNLFIAQEWLAERLGKTDRANALLTTRPTDTRAVTHALAAACTLEDLGLTLTPNPDRGYLALRSGALVLNDAHIAAAQRAAAQCGARAELGSVYLATAITGARNRESAYAIVAGMEDGRQPLDDDDIRLTDWLAADLGARPGDRLDVAYLVPDPDGAYQTAHLSLTVRDIVPVSAADRTLVPDFDGLSEAERIDEWNTPFPVELAKVTPRDERFWEQYRATPKAYVSPAVARTMWRSAPAAAQGDWVTTIRLLPPAGESLTAFTARFHAALREHLTPEEGGLAFRPVRAQAIAAASGASDFGQLFLGMSCFLVVAAAGLAGMLMRLMAERRSGMAGIMLAAGFSPAMVSRAILGEGMLLTVGGVLLGLPLGLLYTQGIIHLLATRWVDAVGASALWLHLTPQSLCLGAVSGWLIGAAAVAWGTRRLGREHPSRLLAGGHRLASPAAAPARRTGLLAALVLLLGAAAVLSGIGEILPAETAFFLGGAALLAAGLLACRWLLLRVGAGPGSSPSFTRLAVRAAACNRGRSLLTIGLLAGASFIIVTVAANTRDYARSDETAIRSGGGGFALRAVSSLPVVNDVATATGRRNLGFPPEDDAVFRDVEVQSFLMSPGEDISCLNIARPSAPKVLGVNRAMIARGGFTVTTETTTEHPWELLLQPPADGAIPAFADADSVKWTLHSGLGRTYTIRDERGQPATVRFVGVISGSIFAGEILVADTHFRRLFPSVRAPRLFLLDAPAERVDAVAHSLRAHLGEMGLEARGVGEVLNSFVSVQNTYLSAFLALGELGLLLGVVGMVVVLLRSALERRREFAVMLATGFSRAQIAGLLLRENGGLLLCGVGGGTAAALVAVVPQLTASAARVNWLTLAGLLTGILFVGLASCMLAGQSAVRGNLLEALREE